jgi:hypothetical protein
MNDLPLISRATAVLATLPLTPPDGHIQAIKRVSESIPDSTRRVQGENALKKSRQRGKW